MNEIKERMAIAVLIDADNIGASSLEDIFKIAEQLGDPIVRRAYGNISCFSSSSGWSKAQSQFGIAAKPLVCNVGHKNIADIALVIDAMSLLYNAMFPMMVGFEPPMGTNGHQ